MKLTGYHDRFCVANKEGYFTHPRLGVFFVLQCAVHTEAG